MEQEPVFLVRLSGPGVFSPRLQLKGVAAGEGYSGTFGTAGHEASG
ncbi:MAG TPA: hypothetical protein VJN94_04595 [Candidatus Binataceae bacterium]|nr:hypothetical protein [Candidatus Binataceae bacterium]